MNHKNMISALGMTFVMSMTVIPMNHADAAWSKSGSSSVRSSTSYSRSYQPSRTYSSFSKTTTSSKITGYGGSSVPSSLSTKAAIPSNPYARASAAQQSKTVVQNYKQTTTSQGPASSPSFTTRTDTSSTFTRPRVTRNYTTVNVTKVYHNHPYAYHGHYYSVPMYYHPYHDTYGSLNAFFLGAMLSHAMEPNYYNWAYAHYNDPSYLAWHTDMMQQAQQNADLAAQLSVLDSKVDQLRAQNAAIQQNTIPVQETQVEPPANQPMPEENVTESVPQQQYVAPPTPTPQPTPQAAPLKPAEKDGESSGILKGIAIVMVPILAFVAFVAWKIL